MRNWWCKMFHWRFYGLHLGMTPCPDVQFQFLYCGKCQKMIGHTEHMFGAFKMGHRDC